MTKKLNFVYEWIGPRGPLTNKRMPTIYDFVNSENDCHTTVKILNGPKPLVYEIKQQGQDTSFINVTTPYHLNEDSKFIYEVELVPGTPDFDTFFQRGAGIIEKTNINCKVIDAIRNKNGYLCITTIFESFLEDQVFNQIYYYFNSHGIPLNKVIYLTNCVNCVEVYENYCQRFNKTPELNVDYAGFWMKCLQNQSTVPELHQIKYEVKQKEKMFLQFNRRYRDQRIIFLLKLYKQNLLNDFYISFSETQPEGNRSFENVASDLNFRLSIGLANEEIIELSKKLPLVLDTEDFSKFPMESSLTDTLKFYDNSLIHVIAETNFYTNIIHITEKTMKPVMYKQPFIFVGPPHSIKCLKSFGFKTFGHLWDESYDNEMDHDKRMDMVIDLLKNLSKLSDEERLRISQQCESIVKYNFAILQGRRWNELYYLTEKYGE